MSLSEASPSVLSAHQSPAASAAALAPGPCAPDRVLTASFYGGKPLLLDDTYVALFGACLGAGCEQVLKAFDLATISSLPHKKRQSTLFKILTTGLGSWKSRSTIAAYLAYHRDWLVRSRLPGRFGALRILETFDREMERLGASVPGSLRGAMESQIEKREPDVPEDRWQRSVLELRSFLDTRGNELEYDPDPFTRGFLFPAFFQLFHHLANQLGLKALDEAFAYHLMLRALEGERTERRIVLVPDQETLFESLPVAQEEGGSFSFERDYDWAALVEAGDPAGREWVGRYRKESPEIQPLIQEGVALLREQQIERGGALLRKAFARWRPLRRTDPSLFFVLGRFYYAGLAYERYTREDFTGAERAIRRVERSIRRALELEPILLPFAVLCVDVPLKQAQIARARCRWDDMREWVRQVGEILFDREPLCVLADGRAIDHTTLAGSLEASPRVRGEHGAALRYLTDRDLRRGIFEKLIARLYLLPGFVLPDP